MAGSFGASSDEDLISGINVTPLVDVVLVLLVMFLITAPVLYQSAIKVQLPKAKSGEQSADKAPIGFTVSKDGELSWDQQRITWEELNQRLAKLGPQAAGQTALISADQATPHGTVIKLMDALRQAGLSRFALNVESTK